MNRTIHQWKNISLCEEDVELPGGKNVLHTNIVHPGAAVILPVFENGEILLINQFRPSLKKWLLELPAGTREPGEDPLECARRELEEETGYSATEFISLGQVTPLAGFCDEIQYLYVAKGLSKTQRLECDEDEVIQNRTITMNELEQMIAKGSLSDAKTIACLYKAKLCGLLS